MKLMKKVSIMTLAAVMSCMPVIGYATTTYANANYVNVNEYILPYSNSKYLTKEDLRYLTAYQCKLARNEIYARHGRMFNDASLQNYFNSKSWYVPRIASDKFSDSILNVYETANVALILNYEKNGYANTAVNTNTPNYILNNSDSRYISKAELKGFSAYQCKLARNEIYARHGRMFNDASLQNYFNAQSWYTPSISSANFSDSVLNIYEETNIALISLYEKECGYR